MKKEHKTSFKKVFNKNKIKPKKSLGQNFLHDKNIIDIILSTADVSNRSVIEVGPGPCLLTEFLLLENAKLVVAIEKDETFLPQLIDLKKRFSSSFQFLINDVLDIDIDEITKNNYSVVSNLPYNISVPFIINMAKKEWPPKWNHLILTVQKEVANRLLAKIGSREYGRLTILLNWRNNIELICNVKPSSFYPKPKVVSSIIKITPKKNNFPKTSFENLEKILRVAFSFRRKTIKNNLKLLNLDPDEILKKSNIQSSLRPQNLSIEDFCNLANLCETALL